MTPRRPTLLSAALRGKLPVLDGKEDHLTGTILGLLAWLPVEVGFGPFLAAALGPDRTRLGWGDGIDAVEVELWPWWDHDDEVSGAEPDAVLTLSGSGGRRLLVVESKWRSGKSGEGDRDQLRRQWANAVAEAKRRGVPLLGLLYATTDLMLPVDALAASRREILRTPRLGEPVLGWVSWREAVRPFDEAALRLRNADPHLAQLAADAVALLERYGLHRFQSLGVPTAPPAPPFRRPWSVPRPPPPLDDWRPLEPARRTRRA